MPQKLYLAQIQDYVQDEGSQIVSFLTQAKAGETVMDWCAGAGGKTLAMAAMMENMSDSDNKYRVLARKYRPATFADLIGQDRALKAFDIKNDCDDQTDQGKHRTDSLCMPIAGKITIGNQCRTIGYY